MSVIIGNFILWLLYTPGLFIRERPIHPERFNRAISVLERIDSSMAGEGKAIINLFSELYHPQTFKTLCLKHF
jgi:hypothetical protein